LRIHPLITGLVAAPFTPLLPDEKLNLRMIPRYAAHLARDRVSGAFICGTTGEGSSLTTAERMQVAVAWRKARAPQLKVIVHVGHNCRADSQALAHHAQVVGLDAIATVAPSFFRPANIADLVDWCAPIASSAPKLPFYYYHLPSMAGSDFPMVDFLKEAARKIPTFAGIKFTHGNLMDYANTLETAGNRYSVLAGRDEILLSYLALGAGGAVGSTYNYAAPIYRQLMSAHAAGDLKAARKWQALARRLVGVIGKSGELSANKAIMSFVTGINCGPVRLPLRTLGVAQIGRVRRELDAIGFFTGLVEATATNVA
jgi:N-acetylneuraminate lyase